MDFLLVGSSLVTEEEVFQNALEYDSPEARNAFLRVTCAGDERLRKDVEALLRFHDQGSFLDESLSELETKAPPIPNDETDTVKCGLVCIGGDNMRIAGQDGQPGSADDEPSAGEFPAQLGIYETLEVVGRGGMGIVLRARDTKLDRIVAIKLMALELAFHPTARSRFLREARAVAKMRHPNVVTLHAVHDEGPTPYLAMEFIPGPSLQDAIDSTGRLPLSDILRIGGQVAEGLAAAHAQGLVHGDIKPANILLDQESNQAKIADFGLAGWVGDGAESTLGGAAGTPQYMSPEQACGLPVDWRSDLYSLGGLLYAMAAGQAPLSSQGALDYLRGKSNAGPVPLGERDPELPDWFTQLVTRLLQRDWAKRGTTARDVAAELAARKAEICHPDRRADVAQTKSTFRGDGRVAASRRTAWIKGVAAALLLSGVVIVIVNQDGKAVRLEVPDGSTVVVSPDGQVEVKQPRGSTPPTTPSNPATQSNPAPPSQTTPVASPVGTSVASSAPPAGDTIPQQVQQLIAALRERNSDFDGKLHYLIQAGQIVRLEICCDHVADLSPLRELTELRELDCAGSSIDSRGILSDLSPLKGLKLRWLSCGRSQVADLAPLRGMPLEVLSVCDSPVRDLTPLEGMPLRDLSVQNTAVSDLTPISNLPLQSLNCSHTAVSDLSPVKNLPLKALYIDGTQVKDLRPLRSLTRLTHLNWRRVNQDDPLADEIVRSISTLETIDGLASGEFWSGQAKPNR